MGRRFRRHDPAPRFNPEPAPDPRFKPLARLRTHVADLTGRYVEGNADGPGLLEQLRHPRMQIAGPGEIGGGRPGKPSARLLIRADLLDLAATIREDTLYFAYRAGWTGVQADRALPILPDLLSGRDVDEIRAAVGQFGRHVHAARVGLGYIEASVAYPDAMCPHCETQQIRCRPEDVKAWCTNADCPGDPETGDRAEWTRIALLTLIQDAEAS